MTETQRFFIRILADHLNQRPTIAQEQIDWQELLTLSENHAVNGIVFVQCKSFIPDPFKSTLEHKYVAEYSSYQNRVHLYISISAAFSAEDIPFFAVKGLGVATCYPNPALRTMGDCDIVIQTQDKQRAHDVLLSLGFKNYSTGEHEWVYFKNGLEFELHHNLLYDEIGNSKEAKSFCDKAAEYCNLIEGSKYRLDWSYHYIFLLLHLHKHLIHSGIGFRQFMDLYVVEKSVDLNRAWIDDQLSKLSLLSFKNKCMELIRYWFDEIEETEQNILLTEKILGNGVFGFDDPTNKDNRKADVMIITSLPLPITRIKTFLGSVFPSYSNMRGVPYYSFLNGRPYLLPAFWIYRLYRAVKYGMIDNGKRMIDESLVSKEDIENRKKELQKWGL